jgi:phage terminase large subunit-like protein
MENPAFENSFKRLYLNMWTSQETRWLALEEWDACGYAIDLESLRGRTCYGGIDLATTTDVAAYVLVFPPENGEAYTLVPFFFVPEETVKKRSLKERIPYDEWARQKYIIPTPGNVIDYNFIKAKIRETAQEYNLREVAYDRWGATALVTDMTEEGLSMIPIGMGFSSMSGPTKEMEKLILSRKVNHGKNPVLRWMFDNVMMRSDPAGNLKPDKEKSKDKIDGIVASIIALDRALRNPVPTSIYDDPEFLKKGGLFFLDHEEPKEEEPKEES